MHDHNCYTNHSVYNPRVDLLFHPNGGRWWNDSASMLAWATLPGKQSPCWRYINGK
ncbi:MAG: hypothetical protein ACJ71U_06435 [Terriglobales bacterium]|jgi:hypothetical protein